MDHCAIAECFEFRQINFTSRFDDAPSDVQIAEPLLNVLPLFLCVNLKITKKLYKVFCLKLKCVFQLFVYNFSTKVPPFKCILTLKICWKPCKQIAAKSVERLIWNSEWRNFRVWLFQKFKCQFLIFSNQLELLSRKIREIVKFSEFHMVEISEFSWQHCTLNSGFHFWRFRGARKSFARLPVSEPPPVPDGSGWSEK